MKKQIIMLWDLDGTLYPETQSIKQTFVTAACDGIRYVVDSGLSDDDVKDLLSESRKEHGDSFSGLVKDGFDEATLHKEHHDRLDHTLIERNEELFAAFKDSEEYEIRHAILTHGHKDWATRVLDQIGIREFFADEDIISVEQIGFLKKHKGPEAFEKALERLGVTADQVIMIEDKAANLKHPKEMGMSTHLIDENPIEVAAGKFKDFVDRKISSAAESIKSVISSLENKPGLNPALNT
jgi:pyrimidine 5'-nucleotidase